MSILLWIIFGAMVGWVASMIMRTDEQQGAIGNIIVGIIGAFIGGGLSSLLGGPEVSGFNLSSIFIATIGAIVLILIMQMVTGRRSRNLR
jgi:uncharacterized membrane protein YeaQ/YmgE (transglycosylase-associated protein family)